MAPFYFTGSTTGIGSTRRKRKPAPKATAYAGSTTGISAQRSPSPSAYAGQTTGIRQILSPAPSRGTTNLMQRAGVPPPAQSRGPRAQAPQPRTRATLLEQLDRPFGPNEAITPEQTALLAEAFGLPGITYSQAIVPGESGHRPGIRNPDDDTPSLFQITPSVQSAETQAKFNKIASKHRGGFSNPVAAAKQAAYLARGSADEGVSNYVAYDPSAPQGHLPGGPKRARELLGMPGGAGKPPTKVPPLIRIGEKAERRFGVEAREQPHFDPVDPVHTDNSMHYSGNAIDFSGDPNQLGRLNKWLARKYGSQTDELFYDPGTNIADGQPTSAIGGHDTHVHFGLDPGNVGRRASAVYGVGAPVGGSGGASTSGMLTGGGTASPTAAPTRRAPLRPPRGRPALNPLAARAPQPRTRLTGELEEPVPEDEDEQLLALLRQLGEF